MYPSQPQYPQQPQFPPAAPQQYPPAQPGYPQQYPPAQPGPGYAPQPDGTHPPQHQYAYPPQPQYAPAPQYAPPAPPPVAGTLDQFYAQPSTGGGKALTFEQPGQTYVGIVTRPIGNGDVQQQTDTQNRPATFRDGRPKFVMKVPLQIQPTQAFPDGLAQWFVKGAARDELARAMAEVGAPEGPPEAGAVISITMTGTRPSGPGMNPTKLFQVVYRRPQGAPASAAPAHAAPAAQPAPAAPAPSYDGVMAHVNMGAYQPAPPPVYATNASQPTTSTTAAAPAMQQPAPTPPAPGAPLPEMSPEQVELLARLTGAAAQ